MHNAFTQQLSEQIKTAVSEKRMLQVAASHSKVPLAQDIEEVSLSDYSGIIEYEPSELVVTVKAGTKLSDLSAALAERKQMLGFEPPEYGDSTIGGTYACALTGPSRPFRGVLRDFVLGTKLIDGRGQLLTFGGQMMKNVAGYDVSRMLAGSKGSMAVVTQLSLKVLPLVEEITYRKEMPEQDAIILMNQMAGTTLPLSGCAYYQGHFYYRVFGKHPKQNNEAVDNHIWKILNPFMPKLEPQQKLWRVDTEGPADSIPGTLAVGMCGQRRWVLSDTAPAPYATLWQRYFAPRDNVPPPVAKIKAGLKNVFDPHHIFKTL
ncbi:FAD-binding protein [Thiosulfativibrio zosterae]|uniref:Glycolate oxidase subunit GlcE n=1 Tax=Thiosulfativibrio zosterae TaxID=2675053 RepID=A0A6F8PQW8_9GAMM|nr:FAD-binding protein [Thiosulfativibrio zosterae]BBP44434.1 glycolate oxidase subunit GlcE [Thiosulfativibrio zosterae]